MTTYTKEEIIPSSVIARSFSDVLNKLKNNKLQKIAVIRNNQLEAVILPIQEYEELNDWAELREHYEIYNIIKSRENQDIDNSIPFENILKEFGVHEDEL
jgi:PHD/YefM family antitoxin component YafN of YafNO toxin-antitoxin module